MNITVFVVFHIKKHNKCQKPAVQHRAFYYSLVTLNRYQNIDNWFQLCL